MTRWIGILVALVLIAACFMPWVTIESKQITVTGFGTAGTNFGKPGIVHVVVSSLYIFLLLLNKTWSKRVAFFICAINVAWAVRNFLLISACYAGECPTKHFALYLLLLASLGCMMVFVIADLKRRKNISPST
jgi:hypothetical protein